MTMSTALTGQIEHITFTNAETGFTIAKVRVPAAGIWTVVGLLAPTPGEVLDMLGNGPPTRGSASSSRSRSSPPRCQPRFTGSRNTWARD
jgi:hypothetical protein